MFNYQSKITIQDLSTFDPVQDSLKSNFKNFKVTPKSRSQTNTPLLTINSNVVFTENFSPIL